MLKRRLTETSWFVGFIDLALPPDGDHTVVGDGGSGNVGCGRILMSTNTVQTKARSTCRLLRPHPRLSENSQLHYVESLVLNLRP